MYGEFSEFLQKKVHTIIGTISFKMTFNENAHKSAPVNNIPNQKKLKPLKIVFSLHFLICSSRPKLWNPISRLQTDMWQVSPIKKS